MALVLAIEPDQRQAAIVKRVVKDKVQAEVVVVDSRDGAIDAIRAHVPDVLLLSALLSPRDEQELVAHLRTLDNAGHLQTHTIPQLASSLQRSDEGQGLFGRFRRKKGPAVSEGCDPDVFAEEVRVFLVRAEEKKRERKLFPQRSIVAEIKNAKQEERPIAEPAPVAGSSWDSPFEWPVAGREPAVARAPVGAEPLIPTRERVMLDREPLVAAREPFVASPDSPIRHSELLPGNPVSSIHDRVEFPSTIAAEEPQPAPVQEPAPLPEPRPEPPPDTLAPFLMFDRARGLRRDAARWLRVDAARAAAGGAARDAGTAKLAMADPIQVRIRSIRVQPAA